MGFIWPWAFLLLPLPMIVLLWPNKKSAQSAVDIPPAVARALNQISQSRHGLPLKFIRWILLAIAWLALITAIAQPYRNQAGIAQPVSGRAMTLLIDLSTSMERKDFTLNNESVDRLTVVKHIAGQFIQARQGDRIGLVLFGSEAFIAAPLSFDLDAINSTLQSSGIGMAGRTTAIGDALGLAIKSLREDSAAQKAIVLLSDGTNNAGSAEPEDAAELAATLGIVVHTIGLGSDATDNSQQFQSAAADLDEATLKSIASTSGGEFFRAQTTEQLNAIYQQIDQLQSAETIAPPLIIKQDMRNLFVALMLVCLLALAAHDLWRGKTA